MLLSIKEAQKRAYEYFLKEVDDDSKKTEHFLGKHGFSYYLVMSEFSYTSD